MTFIWILIYVFYSTSCIIRNLKWQYIETHLLSLEMVFFSFFLKQKVKIVDALLSDIWRPRCSWPGKIISALIWIAKKNRRWIPEINSTKHNFKLRPLKQTFVRLLSRVTITEKYSIVKTPSQENSTLLWLSNPRRPTIPRTRQVTLGAV